ncbi:MAG: DUF4402 domain-containing protein [Gemmatimonadales bacterium]
MSSLVAVLIALAGTARGAAQATVQGQQGLTFGFNIPGVNRTIAPTDAVNAGRFYVGHRVGGQVRLTFTLPSTLSKSNGTTLKVTYSSTSAAIQTIGAGSTTTTFNPGSSKTYSYTTSPDIYVKIGGTVQPKSNQQSGIYTGTITLTVAVLQ